MTTLVNPQFKMMAKSAKTDEQRSNMINLFYNEIANRVTDAITNRRHLILWGDPGSSKSSIVKSVANQHEGCVIHKNKLSALQFVELLYNNRSQGSTVILDDCDSWWSDKDIHSTLMSATDTTDPQVQWNQNSDILKRKGIPSNFNFNGTIIIITNTPMIKRPESIRPQDVKVNQLVSRMSPFCANLPDNNWNLLAIRAWHSAGQIQCFEDVSEQHQTDIVEFLTEMVDNVKPGSMSFRFVADCVTMLRSRGEAQWRMAMMFDERMQGAE